MPVFVGLAVEYWRISVIFTKTIPKTGVCLYNIVAKLNGENMWVFFIGPIGFLIGTQHNGSPACLRKAHSKNFRQEMWEVRIHFAVLGRISGMETWV